MSIAIKSAASKEYPETYWGKYSLIQKSEIPESIENVLLKIPLHIQNCIIKCESGGDTKAKNPKSTARGLMQVIKSSELFCEKGIGKDLDMYNPDDNKLCGDYLYNHGGLSHWESSRDCWEPCI